MSSKALVVASKHSTVARMKPTGRAKGTSPLVTTSTFRNVEWMEQINYTVKSDTSSGPVIITANTGNVSNPTCYPINPANGDLNPWLAPQAAQWQRFRYKYIDIIFKSTVKEYASAGQQGRVYVAFQKDPTEPVPNSISSLSVLKCAEGAPSQEDPIVLRLTAKDLHADRPYYYVATNEEAIQGANDPKLIYPGLLFIGSYGCASNDSNIGEVFIKYSVDLADPIITQSSGISTTGGFIMRTTGIYRGLASSAAINSGSAAAFPANAGSVSLGNSVFGLQGLSQASLNGSSSITLDAGNYMCDYSFNVLSANTTVPFTDAVITAIIGGTGFDVVREHWTTTALTCQPYQKSYSGRFPISVSGNGTSANGFAAGTFSFNITMQTAGGAAQWSLSGASSASSSIKNLSYIWITPL